LQSSLDVQIDHRFRRRTSRENGEKEVAMSSYSTKKAFVPLLILGVGVTVLIGCQNTTVDASRGPLDVENSTAAVAPETEISSQAELAIDPEPARVAASKTVPQPPLPVSRAAIPVQASVASPVRASAPAKPALVTVPARTILAVELEKTLSSHTSQVGENFRAFLIQDVAAAGRIALPRDSIVLGRVTAAKPAKKVGGRARLSLEFYSIQLPNGQQAPLDVVFAEAGRSQTTKDVAIIGGSTLGGAVIGHAVNKGEGTAIGAIVGGLAGAAVANETKAKPVVVNSGTVLTLEMIQPVTVELRR
jgi:hypothetical protein